MSQGVLGGLRGFQGVSGAFQGFSEDQRGFSWGSFGGSQEVSEEFLGGISSDLGGLRRFNGASKAFQIVLRSRSGVSGGLPRDIRFVLGSPGAT